MALRLGLFVNPAAASLDDTHAMVDAAEGAGLDLIGIQDHPYQRRFLDTFALIGHLLARTERLTFFPAVANLPLRSPTMLSKQSASLDVLSGGRFELGLGAGAFFDRITTMGGPRLTPKTSVDALEEAIPIIRAGWSGQESVSHHGEHYSFDGWEPGPPPAHPIGIWLGAYKPRMLRITGALGDGWVPSQSYLPPDQVPDAMKRVDDAAAAEGREPSAIRRVYNLIGDEPVTPEQVADFVTELGFDSFIFSPQDTHEVERLAQEVLPAVRDEVASRRRSSS
jgi:alkanesulfonate monooxygenase SsuD/methylene tetrahydromethanopterin reductase-like flavin-dependent oxidoreductase (luciferase family)